MEQLESEKQTAIRAAEANADERVCKTQTEAEKRISGIVSMLSTKEAELAELREACEADATKIKLLEVEDDSRLRRIGLSYQVVSTLKKHL